MIFLCHKCAGVLSGDVADAYACGCISSYVRDWQEPTQPQDVIPEQIKELQSRIGLYERQGRHPQDDLIANARLRLLDLQKLTDRH